MLAITGFARGLAFDLVLRAALWHRRHIAWDDRGARACSSPARLPSRFLMERYASSEKPFDRIWARSSRPLVKAAARNSPGAVIRRVLKRLHQSGGAAAARSARRPKGTVALPPTKVWSAPGRCAGDVATRLRDAVHGLLSALVTDRHHATKTIIERDCARLKGL